MEFPKSNVSFNVEGMTFEKEFPEKWKEFVKLLDFAEMFSEFAYRIRYTDLSAFLYLLEKNYSRIVEGTKWCISHRLVWSTVDTVDCGEFPFIYNAKVTFILHRDS